MSEGSHGLEEVRQSFRQFDLNGDGVIDQTELTNVLQTVDPDIWTDEAVKTLLGNMDRAATGQVQYEDFVDWLDQGLDSTISRNFRSAYEQLQNSDNESEEAKSAQNSASLGDFKPPKGAKGKSSNSPGVKCDKTLEFGKPIRNAICIGDEVWTVDWHGVVTVRDRDNASKVLGTIPTDRFVWSMLHMKPGLMWMGQEALGFPSSTPKRRNPKAP